MNNRTVWTLVGLIATSLASMPAAQAGTEVVQISAPIFPNVNVLAMQGGADFPTDQAGEEALALAGGLSYPELLTDCAATSQWGPHIVLESPGAPPLTSDQLSSNYMEVAVCGIALYTTKPAWIPQLVDDVDVCGEKLGDGWRLISEADVADLQDADYQVIHDTLQSADGDSDWVNMSFSLHVYARGAGGELVQADLSPGVDSRISPLPVVSDLKQVQGIGLVLRCIQRTTSP